MKTISTLLQNYLNGNGFALNFTATNQSVSIASSSSLQFGVGDIAIEARITTTSVADNRNLISKNWSGISGLGFGISSSGVPYYLWADSAGHYTEGNASNTRVNDGLPHNIAIVYKRGVSVTGFVDGVQGISTPRTDMTLSNDLSTALVIGNTFGGFLGKVENCCMYARAPTAAEIAEHNTGVYKNELGRVLWLPFDDGAGSTVTDLSGRGNNGTLVNGPTWVTSDLLQADARQFRVCDLLTITPLGAAAVYYTNLDQDIVYGGHTFLSGNTKFRRSKTKLVAGIDVDSMDLELYGDSTNLIAGLGVLSACRAGLLDGARVSLDKLYMPDWGLVGLGVVNMFAGRVGTIQLSRSVAKIKTVSDLVLLNVDMPRNIYQPGCRHSLFDGGCTLNPASFIVSGAVTAGSTANSVNTNLSQVSAYFTLGTMTFTSGVNNGLTRTIRQHTNAGGVMVPILPWPAAPATSDTFTALPGDDKQQSTCLNKFNNLVHFRAEPYVPVPETQI